MGGQLDPAVTNEHGVGCSNVPGMPISRDRLRIDPSSRAELLGSARTGHCATVDAQGRPHVVPLWFVCHADEIYVNSLRRSQRGAHLRQGSPVSFCIDDGTEYGELRGVVLRGSFVPVVDDPTLEAIRAAFGAKYWHGVEVPDLQSHEWFRFLTEREVSWDFRKIASAGRDRRLDALGSGDPVVDPRVP